MVTITFILTVLIVFILAAFISLNPQKVIVLQQRFYASINWRMEPISMPKEIRNTRLMGAFLIIFALISCIYYWFIGYHLRR